MARARFTPETSSARMDMCTTKCSHCCGNDPLALRGDAARSANRYFRLYRVEPPRCSVLKIKRVYEKPAKDDGWRVLVDRLWPRGMKKESAHIDMWMKEVAPTDALRKWFAHDPAKWNEFQKRYRAELSRTKDAVAELKSMAAQHANLTLRYGAKDETHNQAVVLLDILNNR